MAAGLYTTAPRTFLGYSLLAAIGLPCFLDLARRLPGLSAASSCSVVLAAFLGWSRRRSSSTAGQAPAPDIDYELPGADRPARRDGRGGRRLPGSLRMAAERLDGPLGEEVRLDDPGAEHGPLDPRGARELLERCETPAVRSFVRAMVQGETLGVSIGQILRNLADEMRKRRKARPRSGPRRRRSRSSSRSSS